jgi:hypothetical protein
MMSRESWNWWRYMQTSAGQQSGVAAGHCDSFWWTTEEDEKCWICGEVPEYRMFSVAKLGWVAGVWNAG